MYTTLITVTDATPVKPSVQTACRQITIGESPAVVGWPTVAWQYADATGGSQVQKPAGTTKEFKAPGSYGVFVPNQQPITLQLPSGSGSSTFFWVEE